MTKVFGFVMVCAAGAALADAGVLANDWHFWVVAFGYLFGEALMLRGD